MRHNLIVAAGDAKAATPNETVDNAFTVYSIPHKNVTLPFFSFTASSKEDALAKIEKWRTVRGFRKREVGVRPATPIEVANNMHNEYLK